MSKLRNWHDKSCSRIIWFVYLMVSAYVLF